MTTTQAALPPLPDFAPVFKHIMTVDGTGRVAVYNALHDMLHAYARAALRAADAAQPEPFCWANPAIALPDDEDEAQGWTARVSKTRDAVFSMPLYAAPQQPASIAAQVGQSPWLRAIDEAMVVHHLGTAEPTDDYETAKRKLNSLLAHAQSIGEYFAAQAVRGEVPGHGLPDWPADLQTFGERVAYQRGIGDARRIAAQADTLLDDMAAKAWARFEAEEARLKNAKAERVHALVNDGPFPGMSEAFDAHMGAACWTDPAYAPDASTWAAAWKAALAAQADERAWLVELSTPGHAPQWWGFNHSPRSRGEWCADSNSAVRFARRLDAERMRLHIIAAFGFTGQHSYERSVSVTEHEWGSAAAQAGPALVPLTDEQIAALVFSTVYEGDASTPHRDAWAAEIGVPFARAIERAHGIGAQAPASTRPADASILGQRVDTLPAGWREIVEQLIACHDEPTCPAVAVAKEWLAAAPQAPATAQPERRLSPFDAVARAMDMASLLAGAVAANNTSQADSYAARLRSHLIEFIYPAPQAPAEQPQMLNGLSEAETAQTASVAGLTVAPAEPAAQAVKDATRDTRKLCTCDGAGRGPGRACVVKAGGRLGDLWRCAEGATPAAREAGTTAGN